MKTRKKKDYKLLYNKAFLAEMHNYENTKKIIINISYL